MFTYTSVVSKSSLAGVCIEAFILSVSSCSSSSARSNKLSLSSSAESEAVFV